MNERILTVCISQTGNATTAGWVVEFPFPTRLLGVKASGSNSNTTTLAVSGGATITTAQIGDSGDPVYLEPDTSPDYADADTAYTFTLTQSAGRADDPMLVAFFLAGEGGSDLCGPNERLVCVTLMQTGNAATGGWVVEFPFPTRLVGMKASGSNANDSTITVAGGATVSATALGDSGDPAWIAPDSVPDYAAADTAYTFTLTQGDTPADDPLVLAFFAVGEGGSNWTGLGERVVATNILQTGASATGGWVVEFPFPTEYMGSKASGSDANDNTLTVAGGAVDAAAEFGDTGDPVWLTPTTVPDFVAKDTAVTFTITQGATTQADDPMVISLWSIGEG